MVAANILILLAILAGPPFPAFLGPPLLFDVSLEEVFFETLEFTAIENIQFEHGNEVLVDGNSTTGFDAMANKGPDAKLYKVGVETANKIVPRAFLLKDQKKVVTSLDGGQTYHDGENVFKINPENAIPISPEKSFEVYSATKIQANAQKALQAMSNKEFDELFTKDLPPEIKKTWPEVRQMIKDGTGFYSNFRAAMLAAEGFLPEETASNFQFVCENWNKSIPYNNRATIQATFRQVFEPAS